MGHAWAVPGGSWRRPSASGPVELSSHVLRRLQCSIGPHRDMDVGLTGTRSRCVDLVTVRLVLREILYPGQDETPRAPSRFVQSDKIP